MTVGQVEDVVGLYLDNHPELRTKPASELAYKALASAFPCKK
ncbi:Rap1a/Tai family immunity protein [Klebsiella pneumoniae]